LGTETSEAGNESYDKREFTAEIGLHTPSFMPGLIAKTGFKRVWTAQRGSHFVEAVSEHSKLDADQIGRRLDNGDESAELLAIAGERASQSGNEAYRDLLARLVAAALIDDSKIDPISYLLQRITSLEPIHLRVLAGVDDDEEREIIIADIADTTERSRAHKEFRESGPAVLNGRIQTLNLGEKLGLEQGIIEAALDDLARAGFVERLGGELRPQQGGFLSSFDSYTEVFWRLIPLGRAAANTIRSVKADVEKA